MEDLIKLLLQLTLEVKNMKEVLKNFNKSPQEHLKETWMDTTDVMNFLHVGTRTIRKLQDKGILPFTRIGHKVYFKLSDLQKILEKNYTCRVHIHDNAVK